MVFSSEFFLFAFLPFVLICYALATLPRLKNVVLVVASLVFYGWGEPRFVPLILGSALANYGFGLGLAAAKLESRRRTIVALAVGFDLALLLIFKYSGFLADNLTFLLGNRIGGPVWLSQIYLPLGISFFTFHAISYIVDVYRGTSQARRDPLEVVLYFVFFPQLIAGPIIRFKDIAAQLARRHVAPDDVAYGIRRFVVGLGKKVLIANTLGASVDRVFSVWPDHLTPIVAWFAIVAYALQIYYDFSGYSDMAIGLARMFGFRFLENFDFPYISGSVQEFWRRWHISLSRWFRDYLYIPLGGNRVAPWRVYVNLATVFFLCGLWHGAKWTFVVWGLIHGAFLVLERLGVMRPFTKTPVVRHVYTMGVVLLAWVFFRSDSFPRAWSYLIALVHPAPHDAMSLATAADLETWIAFMLGCIFAHPYVARSVEAALASGTARAALAGATAVPAALAAIFVASVVKLAAGSYNPFIYFRF